MDKKNNNLKKTKNFYYWMGKISDIFIYPIILLAVITSFSMFNAKMENKVYMLAGHSFVKVLSGSMRADGFEVGDNVLIRRADTDNLRPGDIIAFYYYQDSSVDDPLHKAEITDFDNLPYEDCDEIDYDIRKSREDAEEAKTKIYFHTIQKVYMSPDGIRFFETKGSSNANADIFKTREDFVVGRYIYTPKFVRGMFSFFSSTIGMIILVIVPLTILICMQMLSLLEQVSILMLEKKVLQRQAEFDSEECLSSNVVSDMRNFDKVYLYDMISEDKKEKLALYLWGHLKYKDKKQTKLSKIYLVSQKAISLYKTNRYAYYHYWILNSNSYNGKRIVKKMAFADKVKYFDKNNLNTDVLFNIKKGKDKK